MPRRFIVLAIAMIAMTVAMGFMAMQPENFLGPDTSKPAVDTGVTVGKRLPEFALADLNGKETKVTLDKQLIVLNFWATWCPPCRQEMPELDKFARQHNGKLTFYAINIQEPVDKVTEFLVQNQYTMNVLTDNDGEVTKAFHINSIPTTLVIDKQGIIKYRKSGPVTAAELEGVLNGL
ncbi:Thiol-disulfide oxidoreductase ResA [Sporomusa silvacetica DSM 10669]|uniref:Thiol-disulfide oxidoreductase ResA n=1 Tax=Sporomusa silvacetica DSM 10669 TaxID=1123289 RepID=A0ABZ3IJX6_9FIRM|nr:TlpA disulfide reductase family protein [Sporomusa silvacetica]OZC18690.1 sporulation thiol-disulfide oxidoreductase A precursor [Sporomusa silvacetica DSM 10669]